jgi:phosphatidylglycerophosphate synthase
MTGARKPEDRFLGRYVRVNKYLNRPIASLIVRAALPTRVTPDQVTYAAFVVGLAGAWFFSRGDWVNVAIGGTLAQLSSIVDCADGMLARARGTCTQRGATLDLLLDRLNEFGLLTGIAFGLSRAQAAPIVSTIALLAIGLYFLETTVFYVVQDAAEPTMGKTAEMRALLLLLMCVFGLANRLDVGVCVLALVAIGATTYLTVRFLRPSRRPSVPLRD